MYTNADCTIFNRVYDPMTRTDRWQATQIHGVFWENRKAANVIASGMKEADSVLIFIPFSVPGYLPPKTFERTPVGAWTLRPEDYMVKGLAEYDGPIIELSKHFDDVIAITSVGTLDYGSEDMRHWEVSGG